MSNEGITITVSAETAAALQNLDKFFTNIQSKALSAGKELAVMGAAILGVYKFESMVKGVIDLGSALNTLKARTGGSIADLVVIEKQLRDSGQSADEAGQMLSFMQRSIVQAAEQGGMAAKTFTSLHLSMSLSQLSALNATEQYKVLGAAIAAIENPAKRSEAALRIFGRGGAGMAAVFSDLQKFQAAFSGNNDFGQVMARNAEALHETEISMKSLAFQGQHLVAGFLDQFSGAMADVSKQLAQIDLTAAGQRLGGLGMVIVQSLKDDKFPEMIGLLVEAGFELGTIAAQKLWQVLLESIRYMTSAEGGSIFVAIIDGIMTYGVKAAEFLIDVLVTPVTYMAAAFDWLYDQVRVGFQKVANFLKEQLTGVLNGFIADYNKYIAGRFHLGSIQPINNAPSEVQPGVSFGAALARNSGAGNDAVQSVTKYLDAQLTASRAILGVNTQITAQDNTRATALQRLNALIDAANQKRAQSAKIETSSGGTPIESRLAPLREIERLQKEKLLELDKQLFAVENDISLTNVEKYDQKKKILEDQLKVYQELVKTLRDRAALEDDTTAEQTLSRADAFEKQGIDKQKQLSALGVDPRSFTDEFTKTITDIRNVWGTWAGQMANTFKTVFTSAISSISSGITGLIMGTKTWGQALMQIGNTILTSIVSAIVEMGVKWVMTHVIMGVAVQTFHGISTAAKAAETTAEIAGEESKTGVLSINAILSSIGSMGTASIIGLALMVAALGAGIAAASGAFAEGGRPPVGQMALVGERGPEFFVPDRAGTILPNNVTNQLLSGMRGPSSSPAPAGGGDSHVVVLDERRRLNQYKSDPAFHATVVEIMEGNRWRYSKA